MDAIEEVKSRLNIEDVIGEYVQLRRAGRNFKGLSPFTSERTPSFVVSPEKGIWHDFSSGKGGNVFSFVMEVEGLDFKDALELLARKANVDLSQFQTGHSVERGKLKERLYQALELAAKFYQVQFSRSELALGYVFKKRQFTKEIALSFRLGYSPNTGSALIDFLGKQGFSIREIEQAGLTGRQFRGRTNDMFRGRLMIPLMDAQGRVIGFTARLLEDVQNAPKYINTPQTVLYDKSRHVFGLHLAKEALRREGYAVMVEGNLDVIASHQAAVPQIVATAGTALTEMHLKAISRFTGDVRLAFDQDKAGIAATERAIPIASKAGVSLSIVTIPEGKDPDELVRKNPELWRTAIQQNVYALDWLIDKYQSQLDLGSAVGKRTFSDVLLRVVRQLPDEVEQDHYIGRLAEIIGASKSALQNKFNTVEAAEERPRRQPKVEVVADPHRFDRIKWQNYFLCLVLMRPSQRVYMDDIEPEMLPEPTGQAVLAFLKSHDFDGSAAAQKALIASADVQNLADYVKMLVLQYETQYQNIDDIELGVPNLRARLIRQYVETKKIAIRAGLSEAPEREAELLREVQKLDNLLRTIKE